MAVELHLSDSAFPLQLYEILARTPYGSVKRGEVGIDRLLTEQVFTAAYPLHEVISKLLNPNLDPDLWSHFSSRVHIVMKTV